MFSLNSKGKEFLVDNQYQNMKNRIKNKNHKQEVLKKQKLKPKLNKKYNLLKLIM